MVNSSWTQGHINYIWNIPSRTQLRGQSVHESRVSARVVVSFRSCCFVILSLSLSLSLSLLFLLTRSHTHHTYFLLTTVRCLVIM